MGLTVLPVKTLPLIYLSSESSTNSTFDNTDFSCAPIIVLKYFGLFTGGPDTLRGYRFFSIGPGKYLKTFNYELQFPVRPFWSFIVFQDRGVAADE